jgi:lactoylglutathione lyase
VDSRRCLRALRSRWENSLVLASAWHAAIMLQEFWDKPKETLGTGASVCFMCEDALTLNREFKSRGIQTRKRPFVGNGLWVVPVTDPDGYRMEFKSPTDAPEESELEE